MNDLITMLKNLRRPRLLIRAARFGLPGYCRQRDLRRLLKSAVPATPGIAINRLMSEERLLEEKRQTGDASYSIARHVSILVALMGEARLLEARTRKSSKNAGA